MAQEQLLFCERDQIYGRALVERLQEICTLKADYILFTEYEPMTDYLTSHTVTVLFIEEELYQEELLLLCRHVVLLCSKPVEEGANDRIYKYQSASLIKQHIEACYEKLFGRECNLSHPTKIITLFSYKNDSITSLIAYALGTRYSKSKKTLLINLELLPYEPRHEPVPYNLSDFIYYLGTREPDDLPNLNEYIYQVGELSCLAPARYYRDLYQISREELGQFLKWLQRQQQYDVIIVVTDFVLSFIMEMLEQCSQIIVDVGDDEISKGKEKSFLAMLEYEKKEQLYEKITRVSVPEGYLKQVREGGDISWTKFENIVLPLMG